MPAEKMKIPPQLSTQKTMQKMKEKNVNRKNNVQKKVQN